MVVVPLYWTKHEKIILKESPDVFSSCSENEDDTVNNDSYNFFGEMTAISWIRLLNLTIYMYHYIGEQTELLHF